VTPEALITALVAFLLGLVSGGFLVHYREGVVERGAERRQRRGLRAELEANLDRLRRHREERWPTTLERTEWDAAKGLALRPSTRHALRDAYVRADQYNQRIAQEYKLGSGTKTEDFIYFAASRVDPLPVEALFEDALRDLDTEEAGVIVGILRKFRTARHR
jgi:hypothetical protein